MAEGPANEAASGGQPVIATGTQLPDRWPRYGPAARELGVAAVLAMPLGSPGDDWAPSARWTRYL